MSKFENATSMAKRPPLMTIITARLKGPGGYYNMGNLLGLVAGTAVQIIHAAGDGPIGLSQSIRVTIAQFAGSPSAVALSVAMLIFFWSGEIYYQAWSKGFPPDADLNRRGDLLSGVGAIALGVGLLITGHPMLAATAGLLHAIGKFGSAWGAPLTVAMWPSTWPDLWRSLVLASRVPALIAAFLSLVTEMVSVGAGITVATPLTLILCYLLWIKADLMLFESKG